MTADSAETLDGFEYAQAALHAWRNDDDEGLSMLLARMDADELRATLIALLTATDQLRADPSPGT